MIVRSFSAALLLASAVAAGAASAAGVGGRPLYATLTGAAERPTPGDTDGSGSAKITVNPGKSQVCWTLTAEDIAPATAAHIHIGDTETTGPVVVTLTAPTDGSSTGCVEDSDARAILDDPADYYVNVHTADFPAGAIRGQLSTKKAK